MQKRLYRISRAVMACMLAAALSTWGFVVPASAAQGDALAATFMRAATVQTIACDNGWELTYSLSDDGKTATIEGVAIIGSGKLTIPSTIDSASVTAIADEAFYDDDSATTYAGLTQVELPDTLIRLGVASFMNSGLTSVTIPAKVASIPTNCFANCANMKEVAFAGDTIGSFGNGAFKWCSSLTEITLPEITSVYSDGYPFGIATKCFYHCDNLETIVFRGDARTDVTRYIQNKDCFDDCNKLVNLVYLCKCSSMRNGTGSTNMPVNVKTLFQTMRFFRTAADAEPAYAITCANTTRLQDVYRGAVERSAVWGAPVGAIPQLESGYVWGLREQPEKHAVGGASDTLTDTYDAIPVGENDLSYGWLTSDAIDLFRIEQSGATNFNRVNYPVFYIDNTGKVAALDDLKAYGADASEISKSNYRLVYERGTTVGSGSSATTTWDACAAPSEAGTYRVHAEGIAGTPSAGTATAAVCFTVSPFEPIVYDYEDPSAADRQARASLMTSVAVKGNAKSAVVVPASDWRCQLIGAAVAGAGRGVVLFDHGAEVPFNAMNAFSESRVDSLQIVGSTNLVPQSANTSDLVYLSDYLHEKSPRYQTRYENDATMPGLADQAYEAVKKVSSPTSMNRGAFGDGWGSVAIIASPDSWTETLSIAQFAYEQAAPVFFTQPNGLLSDTDLGYLRSDGFGQVVIAGDTTCVSQACADQVSASAGIAPSRLLASGVNAIEKAIGGLASLKGSASTVVIASAASTSDVTAGSVLASARGGICLPCATPADSKRIQDYLRSVIAARGQSSVASVYVLGDFSAIDSTLRARITDMWERPWPTAIAEGDTLEAYGVFYTIASGNRAEFASVRNTGMIAATVQDFTYNGTTYAVGNLPSGFFAAAPQLADLEFKSAQSSVPENAFKGHPSLVNVDLGSMITSVGANAFCGCASLSQVKGARLSNVGASAFSGCAKLSTFSPAAVTSVGASAFAGCKALSKISTSKTKSIGASAFQKCTALKSITAPKVTSVGASAFAGCAKLASVSLQSKSLSKIGKAAFKGCKKLKALKLKTKKLTAAKVGAAAFSKMPKSAKVYVPKAKVKAYKKLFVKKGLPKKATVKAS